MKNSTKKQLFEIDTRSPTFQIRYLRKVGYSAADLSFSSAAGVAIMVKREYTEVQKLKQWTQRVVLEVRIAGPANLSGPCARETHRRLWPVPLLAEPSRVGASGAALSHDARPAAKAQPDCAAGRQLLRRPGWRVRTPSALFDNGLEFLRPVELIARPPLVDRLAGRSSTSRRAFSSSTLRASARRSWAILSLDIRRTRCRRQ